MLVEPAHPADQAAVTDLACQCGLTVDRAALFGHPAARVWVARGEDAHVTGFLHAWEVADELQIQDLATHCDWRRRGIGRALMSAALEFGRAQGLRLALLEVRSSNRAAIALYAAAGFVPVRRRAGYYADGEEAVEMQLPLEQPRSCCPSPAGTRPKQLMVVPLLRRESIGDAYHVLTFDAAVAVEGVPGQFVMARGADWSDAPLLARPMSYLSGGSEPSVLVKVVGDGTRRFARAEPGDRFTLLGPLGNRWPAPDPGRRPVLVAGGVGIAPLLFLARELAFRGLRPIAVFGGRSARDLPLADELAKVSDLELTTEDGSCATRGRVTDVLERIVEPGMEVFTCGPERMMAAVAALCDGRGLPCHASLETRMACGFGVCLGCAVPVRGGDYLYACVEGPCVDAQRIDWNRERERRANPPEKSP